MTFYNDTRLVILTVAIVAVAAVLSFFEREEREGERKKYSECIS